MNAKLKKRSKKHVEDDIDITERISKKNRTNDSDRDNDNDNDKKFNQKRSQSRKIKMNS